MDIAVDRMRQCSRRFDSHIDRRRAVDASVQYPVEIEPVVADIAAVRTTVMDQSPDADEFELVGNCCTFLAVALAAGAVNSVGFVAAVVVGTNP